MGIDDFSSKKREIFNTIFVDNDKKKKVEVINSREKDDVVEKLKLFKKVKTVTRDFSQTYKNAIKEALPKARVTVNTYLSQKQPLERSTHFILDPYVPMIKKLILEGKKINEIYDEIKANGYKGKTSLFTSRLRGIRQEVRTNTKYLKRSKIKKLLFYDIEEIKDEN